MLRTALIGLAVFSILFAPCSYGELPRGTEIRAFMNELCIVSDEPYLLQLTENDQLERSLGIGSYRREQGGTGDGKQTRPRYQFTTGTVQEIQ